MDYVIKIIASLLIGLSFSVAAEIFQYKNDSGKRVYVDSLSQVPIQYLDQLQKRRSVVELEISAEQQQIFAAENKVRVQNLTARNALLRLKKVQSLLKTEITINANQVIVPVSVTYAGKKKTLKLLLDTGASMTVLHKGAIERLQSSNAKVSYAQVAGGGLIKTWAVVLDTINFGPYQVKGKKVVLIEHLGSSAFDGLLGMDLLANREYQIDFSTQRIIWDKEQYSVVEEQINQLNLQLNQ